MDDDLAERILTAITTESNTQTEKPAPESSYDEKKSFLCKNINKVTAQDKIAIGSLIIHNGKGEWIKEGSEGCMVHLDNMNDVDIVNQMYNLLVYKLSNRQ